MKPTLRLAPALALLAPALALLALSQPRTAHAQEPGAPSTSTSQASTTTIEALQAQQAARNPAGLSCTLSTADGRARFRIGERIPILAGFGADKAGQFQLNVFLQGRPSLLSFGTFNVSPRGGVADPLAGLPVPQSISIAGYVPPPVRLGPEPHTIALDLNEWLRFDRPGVYRVFFSTRRVSPIQAGSGPLVSSILAQGTMSATSNILQLEIVPAEAAWQEQQARAALRLLELSDGPLSAQSWDEPAKRLRYGDGRPFALAMIERLARDDRPRSAPVESWQYQLGLAGLRDRGWLIAQMRAAQARPGYAISESFLASLATLQAMAEAPEPPAAQVLVAGAGEFGFGAAPPGWRERFDAARARFEKQDWLRACAQVELKQSRARALSLHSLLDLAWHARLGADAEVQQRVPHLAALLASALDSLPSLPLQYVLADDWPRLRQGAGADGNQALLASLQRLRARSPHTMQSPEFGLGDLILKRIAELPPAPAAP